MSKGRAFVAWVAASLLVPVGCVAWWPACDQPVPELPPRVVAQAALTSTASGAKRCLAREPEPRDDDTLPDGVRVAPANSGQAHQVGMVPHPLTEQHRRIFRENALIGQLDGAMDAKDARGLHALVAEYRDEYPEDAHVLQEGYELIAQCLEGSSDDLRAAAQRFYDERLDSGLRRYIRRHCLES